MTIHPEAVFQSFVARLEYAPRYHEAVSTLWEAYRQYAIMMNTIPYSTNELKRKLAALDGVTIMGDGRILGARLIRPHWNR